MAPAHGVFRSAILSSLAVTFGLLGVLGAPLGVVPANAEPMTDADLAAAGFELQDPLPAAVPAASCYVKEYCDLGGFIDCSGVNCSAGPEWIKCDGTTTYCPCEARLTCPGGTEISCQTTAGRFQDCEVSTTYVSCNERITYCPIECSATTDCGSFNISCQGRIPGSCSSKPGLWVECDGFRRNCDDLIF